MGKNFSGRLSSHVIAILCLCLCSLIAHLFSGNDGYFSILNETQHMAEQGGILDCSESHAHEDDFIPMPSLSATNLSGLVLKTITERYRAASVAIPPLLPPPKVA